MAKKPIISAVSRFHQLSLVEKIKIIAKFSSLSNEDLKLIRQYQKLPDFVDLENNIGPFKIATNFLVNNKDYFVPMEIEEPSVVASASRAAKLIRQGGGFFGKYLGNLMIGQIQLLKVKKFSRAKKIIEKNREKILKMANDVQKELFKLGGGAKDFKLKKIKNYLIFYLFVDPKDAFGTNMINTMLEKIAPFLAKITDSIFGGRIVSNYGGKRLVFVEGKVPLEKLKIGRFSGRETAQRVLDLMTLAKNDPLRAVTNNKGIMNGVVAVLMSTGNDFRAVEAACCLFAVRTGKYLPLADWKIENDFLRGKMKIPITAGTIGAATKTKKAQLAKKILRVENAQELGVITASVGLANNLAAISVIVTEGLQRGHMKLHKEFLKKTAKT